MTIRYFSGGNFRMRNRKRLYRGRDVFFSSKRRHTAPCLPFGEPVRVRRVSILLILLLAPREYLDALCIQDMMNSECFLVSNIL